MAAASSRDTHAVRPVKQDYRTITRGACRGWQCRIGLGARSEYRRRSYSRLVSDDVRSSGPTISRIAKRFSNGGYVVGMMGVGWLASEMAYDTPCGALANGAAPAASWSARRRCC